jgi:hypothetical protein
LLANEIRLRGLAFIPSGVRHTDGHLSKTAHSRIFGPNRKS